MESSGWEVGVTVRMWGWGRLAGSHSNHLLSLLVAGSWPAVCVTAVFDLSHLLLISLWFDRQRISNSGRMLLYLERRMHLYEALCTVCACEVAFLSLPPFPSTWRPWCLPGSALGAEAVTEPCRLCARARRFLKTSQVAPELLLLGQVRACGQQGPWHLHLSLKL